MKGSVICCLLFSSFLISCSNSSERKTLHNKPGKEELANINKYLIQKDREKIQNYIERKKLPMKESSSGLWYYIIKEGSGKLIGQNDRISFDYECSLLDGTVCYKSSELGPKECIIGKSELESGLVEGLRLLRPGGEAVFILPPFLAFGLPGDGKSIPSRSVIVYNIKVRNR
jgi:FKBP-type peptidyl-prolyl cis-trans isomerase FkpA